MASAGNLWLSAAAMSGLPLADAAPAVAVTLTQTHAGRAWMAGVASLAVLLGGIATGWANLPVSGKA